MDVVTIMQKNSYEIEEQKLFFSRTNCPRDNQYEQVRSDEIGGAQEPQTR